MTLKARNRIIILFLAFLFLPFLFLTNFYPFLRFGMFADPKRASNSTTEYLLKVDNQFTSPTSALNIPQDVFYQWTIDAHHANKIPTLLIKLRGLSGNRSISLYELKKPQSDTLLIGESSEK